MPWFRSFDLDDIEGELEVLRKLNYPNNKYAFITQYPYNRNDDINHTYVTSFQYLIDGVPQCFFKGVGPEAVGIILHDNNDRFVWFKDREKEYVTNDIFHQYLSSNDVFYRLIENERIYMSVEEEVKHIIEYSSPIEGGLRGSMEVMETTLNEGFPCAEGVMAWTEGLFRHIALDISGVVVDPKSDECCQNANDFIQGVRDIVQNPRHEIPLLFYDDEECRFQSLTT